LYAVAVMQPLVIVPSKSVTVPKVADWPPRFKVVPFVIVRLAPSGTPASPLTIPPLSSVKLFVTPSLRTVVAGALDEVVL
jgi:hypothetical protein